MMPGVNYVIYGCSSGRIISGAVITQDGVIDDNLKNQIKNQTLCTCRLFLLT